MGSVIQAQAEHGRRLQAHMSAEDWDFTKVTVLLLLDYVLKEYFGGLAAEWRTYIEELVALPVTVRTTKTTRLIQIHANPRQPARMKQLHAAMAEVNRRALQSGKNKLRFELVDTPWLGPCP